MFQIIHATPVQMGCVWEETRKIMKHWYRSLKMYSNNQGFTLVEILVVMAIIGILATIGTNSFLISRLRGRDAERKSSLGQIQRSFEMYYNDYNRYPAPTEFTWGGVFEDANNVYMAMVPDDPRSPNSQYFYEVSTDGQRYRLYARLENTQDLVTDLNGDGEPGDEYDGTVGDGQPKNCGSFLCNYGISSMTTNMTEAL